MARFKRIRHYRGVRNRYRHTSRSKKILFGMSLGTLALVGTGLYFMWELGIMDW